MTASPVIVGMRMKLRIDETAYYQDGATVRLQYRYQIGEDPKNTTFASVLGQKINVAGVTDDSIPAITQWTDVEFVFNTQTQTGIYRIGGAEGTFNFTLDYQLLALRFYVDANVGGLYVDDLQVYTVSPEAIMQTVTASVTWDDLHNYQGIRPVSVPLTVNGETHTVNAASNWSADFTVPAFDETGAAIAYSATASAASYTQTNTEGLAVNLQHVPALPANTNKTGATTTAFFYNDYEGFLVDEPYNNYYTGAKISQVGHLMYIDGDETNGYMRIEVTNTDKSYYQANFKGYTGGDFTVHLKLSTDNGLAPANVELSYRYGPYTSDSLSLFKIGDVLDSYSYIVRTDYKLASGTNWTDLYAVFDTAAKTCTIYFGNKEIRSYHLPALAADFDPFIRMIIPGEDNVGRSLKVDDFVVYPGKELLSIDDINSPGYYYWEAAYEIPDVAAESEWTNPGVSLMDEDVLLKAVNEYDKPWPTTRAHSYEAMTSANALYYMVLTAHNNPGAEASDGTKVADEAADRIKLLVSGGREPWASVGHWWGHGVVASTMALAKNTSCIWEQLNAEEIAKVDLLMECLAIAANWGYNNANNYGTGFDLSGNFGKTYNPNYKNAYLTCYMAAAMYFDVNRDGGDELDVKFENFNYDSYIKRLETAGFTNILLAWTTVDLNGICIGDYMTSGGNVTLVRPGASNTNEKPGDPSGSGKGVKVAFAYDAEMTDAVYTSSDLKKIFIDTVKYTYSFAVTSSFYSEEYDTYAYILTGETSPWQGQMGMMREFAANENRSNVVYCYLSAANIAPLYANMKLLGYWQYTDADSELMRQMDQRIRVGTEDLFFKAEQGYQDINKDIDYSPAYESTLNRTYGAIYVKDIFMNFHFKKDVEINTDIDTPERVLEEAADPDSDYQPDDPIYAKGSYLSREFVEDFYVPLNGGNVLADGTKVSFDLVFAGNLQGTGFDASIILTKAYEGNLYKLAPIRVYMNNGDISVTYKSDMQPTWLRFGDNYRYHVEITLDTANRRYSITISQICPETTNTVTYENLPWCGNIASIDSLLVVSDGYEGELWIDNLQVAQVQ